MALVEGLGRKRMRSGHPEARVIDACRKEAAIFFAHDTEQKLRQSPLPTPDLLWPAPELILLEKPLHIVNVLYTAMRASPMFHRYSLQYVPGKKADASEDVLEIYVIGIRLITVRARRTIYVPRPDRFAFMPADMAHGDLLYTVYDWKDRLMASMPPDERAMLILYLRSVCGRFEQWHIRECEESKRICAEQEAMDSAAALPEQEDEAEHERDNSICFDYCWHCVNKPHQARVQ